MDVTAALTAIQRYRVTEMSSTVDNYVALMDHPEFSDYDLSSLQGARTMSFVLPAPGATLDAETLTTWAKENMATYKVPRFEIVDELPMTATGKIKKGDLIERANGLKGNQ
jgi:acyl-CoA synthetase (AMP-forming)/AMP-acid ligase II